MFPDTIVVPLDGSEFAARAVPVANAIARQRGGRLLLMTARWDHASAEARAYLEKVAADHTDVDVSTLVIEDRPAPAAIQLVVGQAPGRIVCMTTHGRGRARWALLGSVAEVVVREASDSVILVGRHCRDEWPDRLQRMLVAVDGSTPEPAVLPHALAWARALDLEVHVATVVHPLDAAPVDASISAITDRATSEGLSVEAHIVRSSFPAGALADCAASLGIDLIAMSSHARTGAARFALGSVTIGVTGLAGCAVLVQKAD